MKKTLKIFSAALICAAVSFGTLSCNKKKSENATGAQLDSTAVVAGPGAIVYVDLDVILQEYDMANELSSVVETKIQNIQAEVNRRGKKLENAVKDYQNKINKGLMTRSVAEEKGMQLQKQEASFNNYAAQKQQEIQEEQIVMMNQIGDAIQTFIKKYNEEKKYAMILTSQAGNPVMIADTTLNITRDVLAGLNAEYIKTKNDKNEE